MNIDHLRLFVRLASTHNISQAGKEFGLSPTVASSYINKLEQSLDVRLVHRTTRKVSLTEEGNDFLPHAMAVLDSVETARTSVGTGKHTPQGTLRLTAPASFGRMHLVPGLKGFLAKHPELSVDLRFSDSIVDMVEGGFDIAIRDAELKDSTLVARKLASDRRILCASPEYLEQQGTPQHPDELSKHQCIHLTGLENWVFDMPDGPRSVKTRARIRTDNGDAMRDACIDGHGISINSTWSAYQALKQGKLVQVLPDYPLSSNTAIWSVYPSQKMVASKIRAFNDYFAEFFGQPPYWDR